MKYKDGQEKWIEDADKKWRCYVFSALENKWNVDITKGVYDENPEWAATRLLLKIICGVVFVIALFFGLAKGVLGIDKLVGSMSAGSAALIGYGTAGLVVLALLLGMIFSKPFRIVMLKVFLFILIVGAVIGAVAFFCFR